MAWGGASKRPCHVGLAVGLTWRTDAHHHPCGHGRRRPRLPALWGRAAWERGVCQGLHIPLVSAGRLCCAVRPHTLLRMHAVSAHLNSVGFAQCPQTTPAPTQETLPGVARTNEGAAHQRPATASLGRTATKAYRALLQHPPMSRGFATGRLLTHQRRQ